ncbi:LOW QUALITY PROTEIN: heat shock 70 kDa protein 8 [Argentina anserina]|uniref:LOW QUALITY PROTEIN: heat shock 70 kDa protein 8 n=1 Tax=Argentina anserina TaxID=57926 RepID=UPI0021765A55|nr:LOW QUALITY PROTEIN: heat shock 70 kDa protein 8 [Potentilla anserina]
MAEAAYTVASDSETSREEKSSFSFPETTIGIDIGTSQCRVAIWNGSQVEILKKSGNQKMMSSYVTFKDGTPSGEISNQLSAEHEILSGAAIFNMKRLIGRVDTDPVVHSSKSLPFIVQTLDIGVRPFIAALVGNCWRSTTPEEVLAVFLVELREMAEIQLNRPIKNVVLTVPVSFSRFQLSRIERACAMAGLHILRLMPEPTAVALLYTLYTKQSGFQSTDRSVLIFNMGAGYCDVALSVTAQEAPRGISEIIALTGSAIGGEDLLQNMMRYLLPNAENLLTCHAAEEIKFKGLLRVATQNAIHSLSSQYSVQIDVDLGDGMKICKVVDREEFEEVNRSVFDKCASLIIQCLHDAKVKPEDLNDVVLVGGCSFIPKIKNLVMSICKREKLYEGISPLEAAVSGAALEGYVASGAHDPFESVDLLSIQVTPLSIGFQADGNNFVPIIHRHTRIPTQREMLFTTAHDNQAQALAIVYEGVGNKLEENHLLGYFKIEGIPPSPKGVPQIRVMMDIDTSNVLRVLAAVLMPGSHLSINPVLDVRMPTVDDGHAWCVEALHRTYGATLDLVSVKRI